MESSPRQTTSRARGEPASHPELLDWLAGELIRHEWRLKPIQRLILTSSVYLQDSQFDPTKAAVDPGNRLFWRHEKRRLEGEVVRDALLECGDLLDERMYGPGSLDESHHRRSIYFTVKRSKLVPMMQVFDAPEALTSIGDRPSTTIAPQALLLLNNPNVRQCARSFARRLAPQWNASPEAAIREGYRLALARARSGRIGGFGRIRRGSIKNARIGVENERTRSRPLGLLPGALVFE